MIMRRQVILDVGEIMEALRCYIQEHHKDIDPTDVCNFNYVAHNENSSKDYINGVLRDEKR